MELRHFSLSNTIAHYLNAVEILLYSPVRPVVDGAVCFLWLMSVGTIVCATLWSDILGSEKTKERYNASHKVYYRKPSPTYCVSS